MKTSGLQQRMQDILDAIALIESYVIGLDEGDFVTSKMVRDAVERNIERISEASRHLPEALRSREPAIPWRAIADMGNVLRHGYDGVDPRRIWGVVVHDLTPLKEAVQRLLDAPMS